MDVLKILGGVSGGSSRIPQGITLEDPPGDPSGGSPGKPLGSPPGIRDPLESLGAPPHFFAEPSARASIHHKIRTSMQRPARRNVIFEHWPRRLDCQGMPPKAPEKRTQSSLRRFVRAPMAEALQFAEKPAALLQKAVEEGTLDSDITAAFAYCQTLALTPAGKSTPRRPVADVKAEAAKHSGKGSVLFGGALSQLALTEQAVTKSIDLGKMVFLAQGLADVQDLRSMIGPVIINSDMWSSDQAKDLRRGSKDAEIGLAALCAYWSREQGNDIKTSIVEVLNDMTFDAKALGLGADFQAQVMKLLELEEKGRDAIGASAARKCLFLLHIAATAMSDATKINNKADHDVIAELMKANKVRGFRKGGERGGGETRAQRPLVGGGGGLPWGTRWIPPPGVSPQGIPPGDRPQGIDSRGSPQGILPGDPPRVSPQGIPPGAAGDPPSGPPPGDPSRGSPGEILRGDPGGSPGGSPRGLPPLGRCARFLPLPVLPPLSKSPKG